MFTCFESNEETEAQRNYQGRLRMNPGFSCLPKWPISWCGMTPCSLAGPLVRASRATQEPCMHLGLPSYEYQACLPSAGASWKGGAGKAPRHWPERNPQSWATPLRYPQHPELPYLGHSHVLISLGGPSLCTQCFFSFLSSLHPKMAFARVRSNQHPSNHSSIEFWQMAFS